MVRDNAPKERQRRQLERKVARRAPYDRILIVTEGLKTEPNYFKEVRAAYHLHSANVQVRPSEAGTDPLNVVKFAKKLFIEGDRQKAIQPRAFEKVFAVFDRDDHTSYFDALALAASLDGKLLNEEKVPVAFRAVASIPSFELWLLLHYEDVLAPIHRDVVLRRLKTHIPGYEKGAGGAFTTTRNRLAEASRRAEKLMEKVSAHDDPLPFTAIVDLMRLLFGLSRR